MKRKVGRDRDWLIWAMLLPALVAGAFVWLSPPAGVGVSDDSVVYLGQARNLLAGNGLSRLTGDGSPVPITHFPPLYPLMLAAAAGLGLGVEAAARVLAATSAGAAVLATGLLTERLSRSRPAAGLAAWLLATSPVALEVHTWAMTESLFVALSVLALYFLATYLDSDERAWLLAAAVATSTALLTRYAGYALVVASLGALLLSSKRWRDRLGDSAQYLLLAGLPLSFWLMRNLRLTGRATNRQWSWHPVGLNKLVSGGRAVAEWIYGGQPTSLWLALPAILAVVTVALAFWFWGRSQGWVHSQKTGRQTGWVLPLVYPILYGLFLLVSISFFDRSTPLDRRLLFAVYPLILVMGAIVVSHWWGLTRLNRLRGLLLAGLVIGAGRYTLESVETLMLLRDDARGFAAAAWQRGEAIEYMRRIPASTLIYTNEPEAIYYLLGRGAYIVPILRDGVTAQDRADYPQQLASYRADLLSGRAVLALYASISFQSDFAPEEGLVQGLQLMAADERLRIYAMVAD